MLRDDVIILTAIEARSELDYTNSFHLFGTKLTQWILPGELYIDCYGIL